MRLPMVAALLGFALLLLALGLVLHRQALRAAEEGAVQSLRSTVRLNTHALDLWMAERYADADVVADNPLLRAVLMRWVNGTRLEPSALAAVREHLENVRERYDYQATAIVDGVGARVLQSSGRDLAPQELHRIIGQTAGVPTAWIELLPQTDGRVLAGVARRIAPAGPLGGLALYLELNPQHILSTLKEAQPPGWPGQTWLVHNDGPRTVYLLSDGGSEVTRAAAQAQMGGEFFVESARDANLALIKGVNRAGNPVFAVSEALKIPGWHLVSTLDETSVYAPLRRQTVVASSVCAVLLLLAGLALLGWRRGEAYRRALREAGVRQYYEEILLGAADAFVLNDERGRVVQMSASALQVYGHTREQMLKLSVRDLFTPDHFPLTQDLVRGMQFGETRAFASEGVRADGSIFVYEGKIGLIDIEGRPHYHTTGRDVTQQKLVETRLRIAASFVERSDAAIVITDVTRRILMVNPRFTTLTGWEPEEVLGLDSRMLNAAPASEQTLGMIQVLERDGYWEGELTGRRKNGQSYPRMLRVTAFRDAAGKVEQHVSVFTDLSELQQARGEAQYLAQHDRMTGLPNRTALEERLPALLMEAASAGVNLSIALLNIDRFKNINESLGPAHGNALLVEVARRLRAIVPAACQLFRYGGDEFMLVMEGNLVSHALLLGRLRDAIAVPMALGAHSVSPTVSIGVASYPEHASDADALLRNVGAAMGMAKLQGRNTWRLYTPAMNESAYDDMLLAVELRQAMDQHGLRLYLQPQYSLVDDTLVGMEALLRWPHPTRGMVPPVRFIPMAETSGLIVDLSDWVLHEACRMWAMWRDEGLDPPPIAINLSALQFQHPEFLQDVAQKLAEFGMPRHALEMELTEGLIMADTQSAIATMHQLAEMGIQLAIDDFGTGYSSLSYLQRFPVHKLKIDRSFILNLGQSGNQQEAVIATAVIGMAKNLKLKVIAEGVETEAQRDFLREQGCDEVQGYLYAKPMPEADLRDLLRARLGCLVQRQVGP